MRDVRRADATLRRRVRFFLIVATCVGAVLIIGFERYRIPLREWVLEEPASTHRLKIVFLLLSAFLIAPLLAIATYVWSLGEQVIRAQEFPPPGVRVIRDTAVITGEKATSRGRLLQVLALCCGIAAVVLGLLLWRLASLMTN